MAKPNYAFEKRQRALAKKKKKEEKRMRKAAVNPDLPEDEQSQTDQPQIDQTDEVQPASSADQGIVN